MKTIDLHRLYHEAEALYESGLYGKAAPLYSQLAKANRDDTELERRYGICLARTGKKRRARAALASAVERGCTFPWMVHYELARLHAGLEDAEAALDALEKAFAGGLSGRWEVVDLAEFENLHDHPRFRRLVGLPDGSARDRNERWRHDLGFLVAEAQRLHPGLQRPAYSEHFLEEAAAIDRRIPAWDDSQIVVALQQLLVILGDGHSGIRFDSVDELPPLLMLPVDFYLFHDGLFVVNGQGEAAKWVGARVAKIGAKWTDELLQALSRYVPADNQMQVRRDHRGDRRPSANDGRREAYQQSYCGRSP